MAIIPNGILFIPNGILIVPNGIFLILLLIFAPNNNIGMLKLKIKEVLLAQGKKNPQAWLQNNCNITKIKAHNLINNKQKSIAFADLSKICGVLDCTPNELFWWDNAVKPKVAEWHVCMVKLTKPRKDANWTVRIEGLNPERVEALENYMDALEAEKINENKKNHQAVKEKEQLGKENVEDEQTEGATPIGSESPLD